ncbi:hypothetical protein [Agromyces humatus]|uniref:DUF3558 domain-containing protein n=1 Tax=Agromyces humatus TaxID=279573 RepID=A0ABN2KJ75_9MICO|nr:hypothetical protein [Agromyces humatus]
MDRQTIARVALAAGVAALLGGCAGAATDPGGSPPAFPSPFPAAPVEVQGLGTVLEQDGRPELCLGAVAESYPPQCGGPSIIGWDWDAVDGEQTASEVTWGAYAVWGEWDGATFTLTREPVLAALYDPMATPLDPNPWDEGLHAGPLSEADAIALQAQLPDVVLGMLATTPVNGRLVVQVMFDDGTLQADFDERYGDDAVVVISSLQPVE